MTYTNYAGGSADMNWHVPQDHLDAYVSGRLSDQSAWSVETHVAECEVCADRVGETVENSDLVVRVASVRQQVLTHARRGACEDARVALPGARIWRLLTAAPALRLSWMAAAVFVVACATVLSMLSSGQGNTGSVLFLVAPLLPLAGVSVSYGPAMDPIYELTLTTPYSGLRLLLLRTVTVLVVTIPLLLSATFVLPTGGGSSAAAWLLPALALVLVTLLLGSWVEHRLAGILVGTGWAAAVLVPRFILVIDVSRVFAPEFQVAWAATAVAAVGLLLARRSAYDWARN